MKMLIHLYALALLILPAALSAQETDIRKTYDEFDTSLLEKNGEKALELLSADSKVFVSKGMNLANTASREDLIKEPIPTVLAVFSVRSAAKGVPPTNAAQTLVDMSQMYEEASAMTEIGEITVDGDSAAGQILINGSQNPIDYLFVKEAGGWKVDMVGQLEETEEMLLRPMEASGATKEQFLDQMVSAMSQVYSADVWKPLKN